MSKRSVYVVESRVDHKDQWTRHAMTFHRLPARMRAASIRKQGLQTRVVKYVPANDAR